MLGSYGQNFVNFGHRLGFLQILEKLQHEENLCQEMCWSA